MSAFNVAIVSESSGTIVTHYSGTVCVLGCLRGLRGLEAPFAGRVPDVVVVVEASRAA